MDMLKMIGIAILGVFAILLFKEIKPMWTIPTRLTLSIIFAAMLMMGVSEILSFAGALTENQPLSGDLWQSILKALGIAVLTEIAMSVCSDSGEGTLATWVEMAGKTLLLLMSLPLIEEVLATVRTLLLMDG